MGWGFCDPGISLVLVLVLVRRDGLDERGGVR